METIEIRSLSIVISDAMESSVPLRACGSGILETGGLAASDHARVIKAVEFLWDELLLVARVVT